MLNMRIGKLEVRKLSSSQKVLQDLVDQIFGMEQSIK